MEIEERPIIEKRSIVGPARERFRALLNLAAESPFEGERDNAMAAAARLAEQHGMSLDEAARPPARPPEAPVGRRDESAFGSVAAKFSGYFDPGERQLRADKARRDAALRDALERGLDANRRSGDDRTMRRRASSSQAQRSPRSHAHVLLAETSFSLEEIVGLTGLDIYQVVGLKLKMRSAA